MKTLGILALVFLPLLAAAQQKAITYENSTEDINNPERGFYSTAITFADKYTPLEVSHLKGLRNGYEPFKNAPFKVNSTLVLRVFVLKGLQNTSRLPAQLLKNIEADFATARAAGVKLIIRFAYTFTSTPNMAPPYDDAPVSIAQKHIAQLTPVLRKNADVIAIAQLGFIGLWGEAFYTDHYGRPGSTTSQQLRARADLLDAFLDALPSAVIVQVRYPTMKQDYKLFKKKNVRMPRIGFHNDAFLSSQDDMGTYRSYDITANAKSKNTAEALMNYVAGEAAITAMGGESAKANPPYDKCSEQGGQAQKQLSRFHFTYLNAGYNQQVLKGWASCINEIKKELGYRLVLKSASVPTVKMRGDTFTVKIDFANIGYAAPINSKKVSLLLVNEVTSKSFPVKITANAKSWKPGNHSLKLNSKILATIPAGLYKLYLKVADMNDNLGARPEYCIRFANRDTWDDKLAANDLKSRIEIKVK